MKMILFIAIFAGFSTAQASNQSCKSETYEDGSKVFISVSEGTLTAKTVDSNGLDIEGSLQSFAIEKRSVDGDILKIVGSRSSVNNAGGSLTDLASIDIATFAVVLSEKKGVMTTNNRFVPNWTVGFSCL
jgi:hypothetical protein